VTGDPKCIIVTLVIMKKITEGAGRVHPDGNFELAVAKAS
jgi:hypothetical protein